MEQEQREEEEREYQERLRKLEEQERKQRARQQEIEERERRKEEERKVPEEKPSKVTCSFVCVCGSNTYTAFPLFRTIPPFIVVSDIRNKFVSPGLE